jgi:hypothetical protein
MKRRAGLMAVVATLVLITGLVAMEAAPVYVVWEYETGTQLLWNADEAYIFIDRLRTGWSGSYPAWAWQIFRNLVRAPTSIKLTGRSLVVLRYTSDGLVRYIVPDARPTHFYVVDGRIYGTHQRIVARWTGTQFEPADAVDRQRFLEAREVSELTFSDVNGWSKRRNLLQSASRVAMTIGGQQIVLSTQGSEMEGQKAIDIERPGQPAERIWSVDQRRRFVTKAQYDEFLSGAVEATSR